MGDRLFLSVLWLALCVYTIQIIPTIAQNGLNICEIPGCNCTVKVNPWKSVNCNFNDAEQTTLPENIINREIVEMSINGGNIIQFTPKTFNSLPGLSLLHINGTKKIVIERKTFYNLSSSSLLIEIQNCDQLIIKTGAFENILGHVDVEVTNAGYLAIQKSSFTKLRTSLFRNIQKVILDEGTFEIKGQGNTKRHGPFTTILFENCYIPKIPSEAFYSSLADITFKTTTIDAIASRAFHTNEIAAVSFIKTNIGRLQHGAFTDRTLIITFKISTSNVSRIETGAIMAAITNLTVNHSTLTNIETGAIIGTVARAEIIGNTIHNFHPSSFVFHNWNRIQIEANIIKNLHENFIEAPINEQLGIDITFTFKGNEIYNTERAALNFVAKFTDAALIFDDNLFHHLCECSLHDWFATITNSTMHIEYLMQTSYCDINHLLSDCFNLTLDPMNVKRFVDKVCNNETVCEQSKDDIEQFNRTNDIWPEEHKNMSRNWLGLIITFIAILLIAIVTTFTVLVVRGSRWLKRKGYFRNIQYNRNEQSLDDENTIVTMDESEKLEMPEELTLEFLQLLSQKLDDPQTHQEASEMIERLYEAFIVDDSYGNNNRQEDEAHLYEELNNLNLQIPPPPYEKEPQKAASQAINGPRSILKLMEEKVHLNGDESERPQLNGDYSEPSDAAVHLYSELKQQQLQKSNETNSDSLKSNSSRMAFRPLPDKPFLDSLFEAGPSTK